MKDLLGLIGKTIRQYDGRGGHFNEFSINEINVKGDVISFRHKVLPCINVTSDELADLLAEGYVVSRNEMRYPRELTIEIED